jgi:hypothetical protein
MPAAAAEDPWAGFRFLIGEWVGEGSGQPGEGTGHFTLSLDLQGKVLVRRNRTAYPAANGRPAFTHEDLMVIYAEPGGKGQRAIYFDNEGHVINYQVTAAAGSGLTFVSEAMPAAPRFRLTYTKGQNDTVGIKFEIAPPGKPDGFKKYLDGTVHRKAGRKPDKVQEKR